MIKFLDELSPRELEVVRLVSEGWTNAAIGKRIFIDEKTVDHHMATVYAKMRDIGLLDDRHNQRVKLMLEYLKAKAVFDVIQAVEAELVEVLRAAINDIMSEDPA